MKNDRNVGAGSQGAPMSIIGADMTFVGDCDTGGGLRVDGTLEGSVRAGTTVVVSAAGTVTGNIDSREAVVAGRVKGKVTCAARIEFKETGRVDGEVHTPRMQMVDGALVNGPVHVTGTAGGASSGDRERKGPDARTA